MSILLCSMMEWLLKAGLFIYQETVMSTFTLANLDITMQSYMEELFLLQDSVYFTLGLRLHSITTMHWKQEMTYM